MLLEPAVPAPRRRKRRRGWHRRPLVVAPLLLALLLVGLGGVAVARLESTLAEVRSVSRPPEAVSVSDEEGQPEVTVDTAPAQAALSEAGGGAEAESGLFGRFQDGASNLTDMAGAAAAVAGITDSSAGAMTILIMGVDARPGAPIDVGVKADVLMVLNVDPVAGSCRMLSIPRDTRTELPGYGESKINHALLVGGIPYQMLVVEQLLGVDLNHYVLVDFAAFQQVVDVVGGVPVTVPEEIIAANGGTLFEAGPQILDGARALTYARYRDGVDGDIGRIDRQWAILRGLGASAETRDLARDVNGLLPAVEDHVRTDLTAEEMTALARDLDGRCTPDTVETAMLEGTRVRLNDPILRQSVDLVIIDSPPILAATDPLIIAPNTDGAVLVCRAGATRREALRRAADSLHQGSVRIIGVVLNQQAGRHGETYYYYQGYYGEDTPRDGAAPEGAFAFLRKRRAAPTADQVPTLPT